MTQPTGLRRHQQPSLPLVQMREQHRHLHSKLLTSLVRDAHTTPTSLSPESNTLMIGRPLVESSHVAPPLPQPRSYKQYCRLHELHVADSPMDPPEETATGGFGWSDGAQSARGKADGRLTARMVARGTWGQPSGDAP